MSQLKNGFVDRKLMQRIAHDKYRATELTDFAKAMRKTSSASCSQLKVSPLSNRKPVILGKEMNDTMTIMALQSTKNSPIKESPTRFSENFLHYKFLSPKPLLQQQIMKGRPTKPTLQTSSSLITLKLNSKPLNMANITTYKNNGKWTTLQQVSYPGYNE